MTAVRRVLPPAPSERPPIILVHGAANSALVWTYWQEELAGLGYASYAIDLRGHGESEQLDLSQTSMRDYADDVRGLIAELDAKPVIVGWSMGGLIAMMVAARGSNIAACIGLAPSTPTLKLDASIDIRDGEFGPEEYGIASDDPAEQRAMPDLDLEERKLALASLGLESRRARDERKAGIVIESLPCPLLIVTGESDRQWPTTHYDGLWLDADMHEVPGASHWGLVLSRRALARMLPVVTDWVARSA